MWCLNTFTWNHTVAAFVKAAPDLHCDDSGAVVLARGLTLIYTGHVPFSGSVALGRPPHVPDATRRASSDLIGGW